MSFVNAACNPEARRVFASQPFPSPRRPPADVSPAAPTLAPVILSPFANEGKGTPSLAVAPAGVSRPCTRPPKVVRLPTTLYSRLAEPHDAAPSGAETTVVPQVAEKTSRLWPFLPLDWRQLLCHNLRRESVASVATQRPTLSRSGRRKGRPGVFRGYDRGRIGGPGHRQIAT